jgi:hypothetical protein
MDEPLQDEGTARSEDLNWVLDRLTSRYSAGGARLSPVEALNMVYRAQMNGGVLPEQDLADALLVVSPARDDLVRRVDMAELAITDALRGHGWTWDQIGTHLGRPPETARQNASSRYKRLLGLFPWFRPAK